MKIHYNDILDSTNNEARRLLQQIDCKHIHIVVAKYQSAGRGQSGNTWASNYGENILMSLIIGNNELPASAFFHLTRIASVSVIDYLSEKNIAAEIKWPNDILVNKAKIAGILIENNIEGLYITQSIIGIGLNVNQTNFPNFGIPAISMKTILEKSFSPDEEISHLAGHIIRNRQKTVSEINRLYHKRLFMLGKTLTFRKNNREFQARLCGVSDDGKLLLQLEGMIEKSFDFKEIEWVIS